MSEKLNQTHEAEPGGASGQSQPDYPPFNPDGAEKLKAEYFGQQMQGETAERKDIKPEELCDPAKMREKLEQMGANQEILGNPAFAKILDSRMGGYGLQMSMPDFIEAQDSERSGDKLLTLSYMGEKGDSRYHDRGNMSLRVKSDGSLVLECACADRSKMQVRAEGFRGYESLRSDGLVDAIEETNLASITEFYISRDTGNLVVSEQRSNEMQYRPELRSRNGQEAGIYSRSRSETTRQFDAQGVEQYREDAEYPAQNLEGHDYLSPHLGGDGGYRTERPAHASFNLLKNFQKPLEVARRTSYQRNPDGSMHVRDYYEGVSSEIESCPMNTEHGTDELIPSNGFVEAAHEAAKKQNQ